MYDHAVVLKPQDVLAVLKLLSYGSNRPSFAEMAKNLAMSPSEVHAAMKRAQTARLLHGPELSNRPRLERTRGVPHPRCQVLVSIQQKNAGARDAVDPEGIARMASEIGEGRVSAIGAPN